MAKIMVTIVNAVDGQAYPAEMVLDKPVGLWIEQILFALDLPTEENGKRIRYNLVIERTGQIVSEESILAKMGIKEGENVILERKPSFQSEPLTQVRKLNLPKWNWILFIVPLAIFTFILVNKNDHPGSSSDSVIPSVTDVYTPSPITATSTPTIFPTPALITEPLTTTVITADNIDQLEVLDTPLEYKYSTRSFAWSPNSRRLAISSKGIKIYDVFTEQTNNSIDAYDSVSYKVAWSPNGSWLAAGRKYGRVDIWDAESGEILHALIPHEDYVKGIAWSSDDKWLASANDGGDLYIWNAAENEGFYLWKSTGDWTFNSPITWAPEGELLATLRRFDEEEAGYYGVALEIWDVAENRRVQVLENPQGKWISCFSWSPNGSWLAIAGSEDYIYILDVSTNKVHLKFDTSLYWIQNLAWSPDSKLLASIGYLDPLIDTNPEMKDQLQIWDISNGEQIGNINLDHANWESIAWSPDGTMIAYTDSGQLVISGVP